MMNYSEFILLYNGSERESVRNAIRNGAGFALSSGVPFLYYGNLPSSSPILLASFSLGSYENSREIYISSLEAVSLGHEIVAYGEYRALLAAIKGAEDGNGRIHCVFSEGLESLRFRKAGVIRRILLTGGSVISSSCLFSSRTEARFLITSLSSSALAVVGGSKLSASHPLIEMLDSGKDIFLLRSSLSSRAGRILASEGCPVVDSFSSSVAGRRCIAYISEHGRFSFLGENYDVLFC